MIKVRLRAATYDEVNTRLLKDGNILVEADGFAPSFFPNESGDYSHLEFEVDISTGQILDWPKNLTEEDIRNSLNVRGSQWRVHIPAVKE